MFRLERKEVNNQWNLLIPRKVFGPIKRHEQPGSFSRNLRLLNWFHLLVIEGLRVIVQPAPSLAHPCYCTENTGEV